jgi:CRISPR-associated protein Cas2
MYLILIYDVGEERVNRVHKICKKYLIWIQNSVFEGDITDSNFFKLSGELRKVMDKEKDSIITFQFESDRKFKKKILGVEKNSTSFEVW